MRKATSLLIAGLVTLSLGAWAINHAGACDKDKASAENISSHCSGSAQAASGSACAIRGSMAHVFKQAPGTKAMFKKIDNGVVMTVVAGDAKDAEVVQTAVLSEIENMTTFATAQCPVSAAKAGESCSFAKSASVEKASAMPSCCASKTSAKAAGTCSASKASVETASMTDCPDWMKVLCGANCVVEKTSTGIKVTWTTDKTDTVGPLQAAAAQLESEVSRL